MKQTRSQRAPWLFQTKILAGQRYSRGLLLCITLSAALLTLTNTLGMSLSNGIERGAEIQFEGADIIVRAVTGGPATQDADTTNPGREITTSERDEIADIPEVQVVGASVRARAALRVGDRTESIDLESTSTSSEFVWQRVSEGRAPVAKAEVAMTRTTLRSLGLSIGDVVALSRPGGATTIMRIVGVLDVGASVDYNSDLSGVVTLGTARALAGITGFTDLQVRLVDRQVDPAQTLTTIGEIAPHAWPQTTHALISSAQELYGLEISALRGTTQGLAAVVAILSIVVMSTAAFASVPSRRKNTTALQIIGATRGQVRAAILTQMGAIGAIGGLFGVLIGVIVTFAGVPAIGLIPGAPSFSSTDIRIEWTWLGLMPVVYALGGFIGGLGPAWACTRGSPSLAGSTTRTQAGNPTKLRAVKVSMVLLGLWIVAFVVTILWTSYPWSDMLVDALLLVALVGLIPLFLLLAGRAIRVIARLAQWPLTEIVGARMYRKPLRAMNSGLPVVCATALLVMVWVVFGSFDQAMARSASTDITADAIVTTTASGGIDERTAQRLVNLPGVSSYVDVRTIRDVTLSAEETTESTTVLQNVDVASIDDLGDVTEAHFPVASPQPSTVYLAASSRPAFADGQRIQLTPHCGSPRSIRVEYVDELPFSALMTPQTARSLVSDAPTSALWLHFDADIDPAAAMSLVKATALLGGEYQVRGGLDETSRAVQITRLARNLGLIVCIFGFVLTLIGAVLTATASARTRLGEFSLLRVVGADARSVRRMVVSETLLVTFVAAVGGTTLGISSAMAAIEFLNRVSDLGLTATVPVTFALASWLAVVLAVYLSIGGVMDSLSSLRLTTTFSQTLLR